MRIFFIPGLGEEVSIFDKIQPFITAEKTFIDNWKLLANVPEKDLTVLIYASYLVELFKIRKEDVVIGHSTGGWIALAIKRLTSCRIIQIASWTNSNKLFKVPLPRNVIYWMAKRGFGFNRLSLSVLVWTYFASKPSRKIFTKIFERLRAGDKSIVAKQLMIIFNPVEPPTVYPDLRIHAEKDIIVKHPDETFSKVPGDHFSLFTYPETVYQPINKFLRQ